MLDSLLASEHQLLRLRYPHWGDQHTYERSKDTTSNNRSEQDCRAAAEDGSPHSLLSLLRLLRSVLVSRQHTTQYDAVLRLTRMLAARQSLLFMLCQHKVGRGSL